MNNLELWYRRRTQDIADMRSELENRARAKYHEGTRALARGLQKAEQVVDKGAAAADKLKVEYDKQVAQARNKVSQLGRQAISTAADLQKRYVDPVATKAAAAVQAGAQIVEDAHWSPIEHGFGVGTPTNSQPGRLLNEWRTGAGPQKRVFDPSSDFSREFARAPSVQGDVQEFIAEWQSRKGGWDAQGGTYTEGNGRFGPKEFVVDALAGNRASHVIGSFEMDGRKNGEVLEWTAKNNMGRRSFYGGAWTGPLGVPNVDRPQRQGTTQQFIRFRTDLNGNVLED